MNKEYINILKNFIHGTQCIMDDTIDKVELTRIAYINSTTSILAKQLAEADPPDSFLKPSLEADLAYFALKAEQMRSLKAEFERAGIDFITFKGYVVREFYPVPELRTFGDIDLVIKREDRAKSDELMISLGFERKDDWEPVYSYIRGNEIYEIHTEVLDTDISEKLNLREYFYDIWSMAYQYDGNEYRLKDEEHFIYILAHLAKHMAGSGAGIRMYMDIAVYIKARGSLMDWERVRKVLLDTGFYDFASTVIGAVYRWFDIEAPFEISGRDEEFFDTLLEFTLSGGTFGFNDRDLSVMALKNEEEDASRTGAVFRRMFPAAKTLAPRYTYLEDKPWLLPVAWVHRIFKNKEKIGNEVRRAEGMMKADSEDLAELRKLYREIGL